MKKRMFFLNDICVYSYTFQADDKDLCLRAYQYIFSVYGKTWEDISEKLEVIQ